MSNTEFKTNFVYEPTEKNMLDTIGFQMQTNHNLVHLIVSYLGDDVDLANKMCIYLKNTIGNDLIGNYCTIHPDRNCGGLVLRYECYYLMCREKYGFTSTPPILICYDNECRSRMDEIHSFDCEMRRTGMRKWQIYKNI
jgi:hypothetical protein